MLGMKIVCWDTEYHGSIFRQGSQEKPLQGGDIFAEICMTGGTTGLSAQ